MAISFPALLDTLTNPSGTDPTNSPDHAAQHSDANDGVEALQAKVGIDSSAVVTSLDYLLKNTLSTSPGHKHLLAEVTDVTSSALELNYLQGITLGTVAASKAVTADSGGDINFGAGTMTFAIIASALALSGNDITASNQVLDAHADNSLSGTAISSTNKIVDQNSLESSWIPSGETWIFNAADDPTGIIQIATDLTGKYSAGMKMRFVNGGNTVYGIITNVAFSSPNTLIKFVHEIDTSIPTQAKTIMANSAITLPFFSTVKAPYGFPTTQRSWALRVEQGDTSQSSPTVSIWYNKGGTISIPIGEWEVEYESTLYIAMNNPDGDARGRMTLSTGAASESDTDFTDFTRLQSDTVTNATITVSRVGRTKFLDVSSKTTYYLNIKSDVSNTNAIRAGFGSKNIITAKLAYF